MSGRTFRRALRESLRAARPGQYMRQVREEVQIQHAGFVDWSGEEAALATHTLATDLNALGIGAFVRGGNSVVLDGTVDRGLLEAMIRRYTFVAQATIR